VTICDVSGDHQPKIRHNRCPFVTEVDQSRQPQPRMELRFRLFDGAAITGVFSRRTTCSVARAARSETQRK